MSAGSRAGHQVGALAGAFQATTLVRQIALEGTPRRDAFATSLASVFTLDARTVEDAIGTPEGLRVGLETVLGQLDNRAFTRDREIARYTAGLMHLERRLAHATPVRTALASDLRTIASGLDPHGPTHEPVVRAVAEAYVRRVSPLGPRILIRGEPFYLDDPLRAAQIRALLMAGLRALVMWRQLGGGRLRLLFGRRGYVDSAERTLAALDA